MKHARIIRRGKKTAQEKIYVYGRHALTEALSNAPQVVRKVLLAPNVHDVQLRALLEENAVPTTSLSSGRGTELAGRDAVHQGIIALINSNSLFVPLDEFLHKLDLAKKPAIVLLGEVQDPHNVGAIIRSAAAFGFSGVIIPEHNQAPVTGAVIKASAGMVFRIPLISVGNLNFTLETLKRKGFWIYGLSTNGTATLSTESFDTPSAFIVGNEATGVREKTLKHCDVTLSISMHTRSESLNAAASAAIAFYEWSKKHPEAL